MPKIEFQRQGLRKQAQEVTNFEKILLFPSKMATCEVLWEFLMHSCSGLWEYHIRDLCTSVTFIFRRLGGQRGSKSQLSFLAKNNFST